MTKQAQDIRVGDKMIGGEVVTDIVERITPSGSVVYAMTFDTGAINGFPFGASVYVAA